MLESVLDAYGRAIDYRSASVDSRLVSSLVGAASWERRCSGDRERSQAVKSAREAPSGMGLVLLSVRSQGQSTQPLHIWLERADGTVLRFSHRGMGLGPVSRTLESDARVYAVPPGRWTLRAHAVGCAEMPAEKSGCFISAKGSGGTSRGPSLLLPTGTYQPGWIELTVVEGRFLNAGEFMLEAPPGTVLGGRMTVDQIMRERQLIAEKNSALRVKWRPIPAFEAKGLVTAFAPTPQGGSVVVAEDAKSKVECTTPPRKLKLSYHPFRC